ncbi:MAG: hypothetical protein ABEJ07_06515 [Candidatus Nanohaloarchaea archaeon]
MSRDRKASSNGEMLSEEEVKEEMETLRALHHECMVDSLNDEVVSKNCLYRNMIANNLEDQDIEVEFCLTCGFPVAPRYEVERNSCPRCDMAFDIPEELKDNPEVEDKETLMEQNDYSWSIALETKPPEDVPGEK